MAMSPDRPDDLTRLQSVQDRVRAYARNNDWFGDALRAGFVYYLGLSQRFHREKLAMYERRRQLARDLLVKGRLADPKVVDNSPCMYVRIEGLCPVALAAKLEEHRGREFPEELEQQGAEVALEAFDRDTIYQSRDLPDEMSEKMAAEYRAAIAAKSHVSFQWRIVVARPVDWEVPADPHSLDPAHLQRFSDTDYRAIALYRLGGLADSGALRPIVPEPESTDDFTGDMAAYAAWLARLPIDDKRQYQNQPLLSVQLLEPDVAEQMWGDVEEWAKGEAAKLEQKRTTTGTSRPPEPANQEQPAAVAFDSSEIERVAERAAAKALEAWGEGDEDEPPNPKLPKLQKHDRQAWQLYCLQGMTQQKVADTLNAEHDTTYTQGQVSRMIRRAKAHAEASGLAEKIPAPATRAQVVDPSRLELGARTDKRTPRPSDSTRADEDTE